MKFSFHPEAEEELLFAIDYYEECSPGLGTDSPTVFSTQPLMTKFYTLAVMHLRRDPDY